jgi:membrane associated rhomboid family serine protease
MHGSFGHLLSNMFVLWMFGSVLENLWGSKRFLIFYLICGLGAALLHLGALYYENYHLLADFNAFKQGPTLQKYLEMLANYSMDSGYDKQDAFRIGRGWEAEPGSLQFAEQAMDEVISFVNYKLSTPTLGASGAVFGCLAAFGYLFPNTYIYLYFFVPIKAKWFVIFYIIFELVMAIKYSAGSGIAHWAHLGGALVGFLLVYFWNKTKRRNFY